ncbi:alanine racemase [Mycobacterium xenopi 4042]|uniref:Alanine racemase n=1 Tax=Mycobacterium xenopi 4042 TaxID=1299334 RepID=X7YLH0_MYCXE|nr:alanine racemase [Mycobacterium xenopi 4042]EUA52741.1 alanine racemase [Mycobacterium xenopi 3993]
MTVKVDTGLNRNGVGAAQYPAVLTALRRATADGAIRLRGIMSHLVYADEPDHPTNELQYQRFCDMLAQARSAGVQFEVAHLANSSASLTRPDFAFDMVRPGIAIYGLSPIPERGDMGLIPAMTVKCAVALVRSIRAGEGVSYGHTWIADRDTNLALLPVGYADGVFRMLGGRLEVLINGKRRRGVGGSAWTSSSSTSVLVCRMSPRVMRQSCSGRALSVNPPRKSGPICSTPSTTRW